jgi:hypothetical protein
VPGVSDFDVASVLLMVLVIALPLIVAVLLDHTASSPAMMASSFGLVSLTFGYFLATSIAIARLRGRYTRVLGLIHHLLTIMLVVSVVLALVIFFTVLFDRARPDLVSINRCICFATFTGVSCVVYTCRRWAVRGLRRQWIKRVAEAK